MSLRTGQQESCSSGIPRAAWRALYSFFVEVIDLDSQLLSRFT
jgi:hypothetical protein